MPPQKRELEFDSEEDLDYVPPADVSEPESDSEHEGQGLRETLPSITEEDETKKKSAREALWADFKVSVSAPSSAPMEKPSVRMVKIEKRYRFAGEDLTEVKEVHEDSEEAKKWPLWRSPSDENAPQHSTPAQPADQPADSSSSSATPGPSDAPAPKPTKRPGPRKPKTQLTPLPGAQKAKKLTTLDKSALDWRAHVDDAPPEAGLRDELDAHRRGGGYLEKVEFLQRVEQRKEEALEASRATKRRRTIA